MRVHRTLYLEKLVQRMHNGMIKIITGLRRSGKTYLLFNIFVDYLKEQHVSQDRIIKISLDTLEGAEFRDPEVLLNYIENKIKDDHECYYVLIDEIQYAISNEEYRSEKPPRIYDALNSLIKMKNVDTYITGSNSHLLSCDVLTEFRGRGDEIRLHPLSFSEFMQAYPDDIYKGLDCYMHYGGMPQCVLMQDEKQKALYLKQLFNETYLKDMLSRHNLRKSHELESLVNIIASNIGSLTSVTKISSTFRSALQTSLSPNTIKQYLTFLEDAFLISEAKRFDVKGRRYIGAQEKYYFEDLGLRNALLNFRQLEHNHIMENIIYNELRLRDFSVDVGVVPVRTKSGEKKQLEADFVVNFADDRYYIQSAYSLYDAHKRQQELEPLLRISDNFKKCIVVHDIVSPYKDENGISTISIYDFLLNPNALLL